MKTKTFTSSEPWVRPPGVTHVVLIGDIGPGAGGGGHPTGDDRWSASAGGGGGNRPSYAERCSCGMIHCICDVLRDHHEGCRYRKSVSCAIPIECDHGYDVCPQCDPCTCAFPADHE